MGKSKVHTVKASVVKQKVVFQLDGRSKVNGERVSIAKLAFLLRLSAYFLEEEV